MINKKFIQAIKGDYDAHEGERRQIISRSNDILHNSKRVIFSLHRGDNEKAEASLKEIEKSLIELQDKFGTVRLNAEGAYKAGVDEYVEAKTYWLVLNGNEIDRFDGLEMNFDSYLGGLCDLTGELVRRAINEAAGGNRDEVKRLKGVINDIMAELVEFDLTGYLRTKYDQAKGSLRKIEQINYDIETRR